MPYIRTPAGITPPTPGLDHEEPDVLVHEDDIPCDDAVASARGEHATARDEPVHRHERE